MGTRMNHFGLRLGTTQKYTLSYSVFRASSLSDFG